MEELVSAYRNHCFNVVTFFDPLRSFHEGHLQGDPIELGGVESRILLLHSRHSLGRSAQVRHP